MKNLGIKIIINSMYSGKDTTVNENLAKIGSPGMLITKDNTNTVGGLENALCLDLAKGESHFQALHQFWVGLYKDQNQWKWIQTNGSIIADTANIPWLNGYPTNNNTDCAEVSPVDSTEKVDIAIFREHYFSRWQDDAIIQQRQHPILIYQPKTMDLTIQSGFSVFHACPTSNCIITSLESHIATADVIFFAENSEWMPPVIRNPAQIWIIRLLENPMNTVSLTAYNGMVNYTAGYRPDCNLLAPYGAYRNFSKNQNSSNEGTIQEEPTVREGIVWLVSNCFTGNNRLGYARALQKHYKVHIYGKCDGKYLPKKEEKITLQKYKYYLAFENQNCRHYITEKFWNNALGNNLIPIVMGPPKHDYQLVAPPGSFIHTDDFKSAEDLARYLLEIDENEKLYLSFFDWKKEGYLTDSNFYCRLCAFVQNPRPSTYSDIDTFWRSPKQCAIANYTKRLPVL